MILPHSFTSPTDGCETINCISCEPAHGFGDDKVDLPGEGIFDHLIKPVTALRVDSGNTLIGIYLYKFPVRLCLDVAGVVVDLCLIAGILCFSHYFLAG